MANPKPMAGGLFLFLGIVGGFLWGAASGEAMRGVLVGTIAGASLAFAFWLVERRRP
ncbi:MAG TPA: hypothetical protein VFK50_01240 [Sphingomicrobium sp.]|nr:hypothetical protein [Sphingomicrobium sp.]